MSIRKTPFENGEFYHIYNRGVDKRNIFDEIDDIDRFIQSMEEFNVIEPIGSIYENSFIKKELGSKASKFGNSGKLVNFVCYCLNPNHYHFVLEQVVDKGIEKFMHRLGTGYTRYFNDKYDRTGSLFQGRFKSVHIKANAQLLHTSVYVNLNDRVHPLGGSTSKWVRSSWEEYVGYVGENGGDNSNGNTKDGFCKKNMTLGQFKNVEEYKKFAEESLEGILERRRNGEEAEKIFIE